MGVAAAGPTMLALIRFCAMPVCARAPAHGRKPARTGVGWGHGGGARSVCHIAGIMRQDGSCKILGYSYIGVATLRLVELGRPGDDGLWAVLMAGCTLMRSLSPGSKVCKQQRWRSCMTCSDFMREGPGEARHTDVRQHRACLAWCCMRGRSWGGRGASGGACMVLSCVSGCTSAYRKHQRKCEASV